MATPELTFTYSQLTTNITRTLFDLSQPLNATDPDSPGGNIADFESLVITSSNVGDVFSVSGSFEGQSDTAGGPVTVTFTPDGTSTTTGFITETVLGTYTATGFGV